MFMPGPNKNKQTNTFPMLKGKAAQIRHVLGPMMVVCKRLLDRTDAAHIKIIGMLECAIRMEDAMDHCVGEYALPPDMKAQYKADAERFVRLNTALGHHFHNKTYKTSLCSSST